MNNANKGSLVAERTLKALMLFSKKKYLSVAEVAASLEISLTAAYRLVETLNNTGFIKREQSKEYSLDAPNILQLYNMVEQDIREVARPIIKKLAMEFRESVYLSIVHNDNSYYSFIEGEDSPSQVKWSEHIGRAYPLATGTAGKTHLAYLIKDLNESEREAIISKMELTPYTENTIVTIEKLKKSLEKILDDGYCYTNSEHLPGAVGISVPVFNFKKTSVGAVLSVFMPNSHFDESELKKYVTSLIAEANKIGKSIP
ncbi:IclR family transcriptional regulator [Peribacillus simplex]